MSRVSVRPYLVTKDEDGRYRLTVRTTRFNSQGYPLVDVAVQPERFATATAAKAHAKAEFRAQAGDFALK